MRLFMLLALLGLGFAGMTAMLGDKHGTERQTRVAAPQTTETAQVSRADTAPQSQALPHTVRRLADAPVTGPTRPTIISEPLIDPSAVQPMVQLRKAAAASVTPQASGADIRKVTSSRANVRGGPSTGHAVVGSVARGDEVEVIGRDPSGWVQIRIEGDGIEGWVAERLLAR